MQITLSSSQFLNKKNPIRHYQSHGKKRTMFFSLLSETRCLGMSWLWSHVYVVVDARLVMRISSLFKRNATMQSNWFVKLWHICRATQNRDGIFWFEGMCPKIGHILWPSQKWQPVLQQQTSPDVAQKKGFFDHCFITLKGIFESVMDGRFFFCSPPDYGKKYMYINKSKFN